MVARGLESADMTSDTVKILGVPFLYNKKNQKEKNLLQSCVSCTFYNYSESYNRWTDKGSN